MKLNEKISYCRKKAGLSQVDLADLLGVSRQAVSKWETGETNPEVTKIPPLAKAFGVSADWLLSEEEPLEEVPVQEVPSPAVSAYPDWVEQLPKSLGRMVKKFGWIYGVRMAIGGGIFTAMGCLARALFKRMIFGFSAPGMYGTEMFGGMVSGAPIDMDSLQAAGVFGSNSFAPSGFASFNNTAWSVVSLFTGFMILLGVVIMVGGIVLAIALKKWGDKA